jgi:hypothetical protein
MDSAENLIQADAVLHGGDELTMTSLACAPTIVAPRMGPYPVR